MGKEGVGIPIIMGLALSTRKVPWEVAKPIPFHRTPAAKPPNSRYAMVVSLFELNFRHPYLKNSP